MKGCQNQDKARRKVAKIHEQIKNAPSDYLHKLTTRFKVKSEQLKVNSFSLFTFRYLVRGESLLTNWTINASGTDELSSR
jgi:transposase|uniref:hypothetical protein n=1 Tax=Oxynema aestuarii TaxID=2874213 RepID=UPI001B30B423|nr:hypothetical protein [Oxynema aestuarii]